MAAVRYHTDRFPTRRPSGLAEAGSLFEALHPFPDGNGRPGRIPVPLFLWQHDHGGHPGLDGPPGSQPF